MKADKLVEFLLESPEIDIDEDEITSVAVEEGIVTVKTVAPHPLYKDTLLHCELMFTEEEIDITINDARSGKLDKIFGMEDKGDIEIVKGTQSNKTEK